MASYREHLAFSATLGFVYGGIGASQLGIDPAAAVLGAGVTTVAGLLPDLDSDSGVPVRELFGVAAAFVPLMLMKRLMNTSLTPEEVLVVLVGTYVAIRYGLSRVFKRVTVHRGMFHSIPGMLIAGLLVFLGYEHPSLATRAFLAGGAALGFLSHLVLDELYSVDFRGLKIRLNKYAGSALKFASSSYLATGLTYAILGGLIYLTWADLEHHLGRSPVAALFGEEPPAVASPGGRGVGGEEAEPPRPLLPPTPEPPLPGTWWTAPEPPR